MSLLIDEFGRPIILFDAQDTKKRVKGPEAYKVRNIIINILYYSLTSLQQEESQTF